MNVQLSPAQLAELNTITLTRRDKLFRLAQLIRSAPHQCVMFSGIEYMTHTDKTMAAHPRSIFAVAVKDSVLKDAGLQGESVAEGQRFFELSIGDLHAFSCDCGGQMSNDQMARRVEAIAARSA